MQDISRKVPAAWLPPEVVGLECLGPAVSQLAATGIPGGSVVLVNHN